MRQNELRINDGWTHMAHLGFPECTQNRRPAPRIRQLAPGAATWTESFAVSPLPIGWIRIVEWKEAGIIKTHGTSIRLQWIPGHCEMPRNDTADVLAKEAAIPGKTHPFSLFYS
ncbi:Probable transposable element [Penicillium roqueforti FM164]|uniref:Probable transposable element n=1 Tax=Penicillium roqueforti (strain FM164) TaxID=1365484 RepID=W6QW93_PENRF|nr:Probable transposable element [Penicillium roqueforti FM164]